jgi:3-oxoacyl-[acyl-carrier protein] reductase
LSADVLDAFRLEGRVAVVTGAGSGIGRATAGALAGAGASVVCADIDKAAAKETARTIGGHAVRTDVSSRAEVEQLVAGAVTDLGRLDIMCNVAGIIHQSTVIDTDEADLDRVIAVNLKGVFFGCQAAARVMVDRGKGSIVNMASGAIDAPAPGLVCYAMAKAAVAQMTKTLAVEVARKGVRVNAIAPGFIVTNMTARHYTNPDGTVDEERREAALAPMRRRTPLGVLGEPDDIALAVLYLASDASKYVTGQVLRANGGVSMP